MNNHIPSLICWKLVIYWQHKTNKKIKANVSAAILYRNESWSRLVLLFEIAMQNFVLRRCLEVFNIVVLYVLHKKISLFSIFMLFFERVIAYFIHLLFVLEQLNFSLLSKGLWVLCVPVVCFSCYSYRLYINRHFAC